MNTPINIKAVLILVLLSIAAGSFAQNLPSGGYQGGKHGNVTRKTWSGAIDEKWNVAGNWCPAGVPGVLDDVVIPATAAIMPEVKVQSMSCKDLTIMAGASLKISPDFTLNVTGLLTIEQ
ncbi:MAG: hypothetical protein WCJ26_02475 [bacterium]